jgi:SAM-dependent methyltransferase
MAVQMNAVSPVQVHATEKRRARPAFQDHVIPGFARPGAGAGPEAWAAAFEDAYSSASGDLSQVPWCCGEPDPALVSWIDSEAPGLVRPGATVAVVGCGTGDDAAELASRGYDVTAMDVSPTAIAWAQRRFGHMSDNFLCADLLALPASLRRRADLVVEVETLSWLPPELREAAAASLVAMARPRGMVLIVSSLDDEQSPDADAAAPFPLAPEALASLMAAHGMSPMEPLENCVVEDSGRRRLCAAFRRS